MPDNKQNRELSGEEPGSSRVEELEGLIDKKDQELAARDLRISELEQAIASRDNQIAALKQSVTELEQRLGEAGERGWRRQYQATGRWRSEQTLVCPRRR